MFYIVSTCFSIYHVSIISAIFSHKVSELNSKSYLLQGGTAISSNSDMNNYTEIGNYYANSEIAQSLQNAPFNRSFTMKIDYGNGTGYICQTYREIDTGRVAIRYNNNQVANAEQWQPFVYFSDDATVSSYQTMTSTNDVLQSAENQPANQIKFYWLGGAGYTGDIPSGGSYSYGTAIALKRGTSSIFVVIFSIGKPIYNSYTNNSWSGWKDCTGTLISS